MVNIIIDGKQISAEKNQTILEVAKQAGINIPHLCYLKELNEVAACRVCVVEIKGMEKLSAACNTKVAEGMEIYTNSERVRNARRTNVQLILSEHNCHCPTCVRNKNCALQTLGEELNILDNPYEEKIAKKRWIDSAPLVRDETKCIKCMRCVSVCDKIQGLKVWELNGNGSHSKVTIKDGLSLDEAGCALCGQCITHCPVGALYARDDTEKAFKMLADKDKITIIQIAPAVRSAWGDGLNISPEIATEKRMASAAKMLGAKYVFDTNFSADMTIMEEVSELIHRIKNGGKMPMFTSCCPGWVRFIKHEYPSLVNNLSTAKSPQQMFGAIAKTYFAEKAGVTADKINCISIMPCSSKKFECDVKEVNDASDKDVDLVLTTREFTRMLKASHIDVASLEETEFDSPLGSGSGAAVIFGATGGVMEAALRTAYYFINGKNPTPDEFKTFRGKDNPEIRTAELTIGGVTLRAAVTSGLKNARLLCEDVKNGTSEYDFIEIMACPGGCAGGGGQPISDGKELAIERGSRLYNIDSANEIRFSHENPDVITAYNEYFGEPLSEKSHSLLHTKQEDWTL